MGIFKRRKPVTKAVLVPVDADQGTEPETSEEVDAAGAVEATPFDRANGPFDRSEIDSVSDHIDLGALLLHGVEGMQLRLELDADQSQVVAATALLGDSSLQLQSFAAPRSGGLWAEIRDEIAASVVERGGTAEVVEGPFGTELRTRVPSADASGRTVFAPARFLGVDGPRWFLRGVLAGRGAIDEGAATALLDFFGRTVVVRGDDPMPPRELLPLVLPTTPEAAPGGTEAESVADAATEAGDARAGRGSTDDLNPFERGPEITEVR